MGAIDLDYRGSTVDELRRLLQSFSSDARCEIQIDICTIMHAVPIRELYGVKNGLRGNEPCCCFGTASVPEGHSHC